MRTQYIIHADDFGQSSMINQAIDECFMRDWISETSLMVNMPGCNEAVEMAKAHGYVHRVGLHLNLQSGRPLTDPIKSCSSFCSRDGFFTMGYRTLHGRFFLPRREMESVGIELEAQMRKFIDICGSGMMKIDSHHHTHTDWSIYRILEPLAINLGFVSMRISADLHRVGFLKGIYKKIFNARVRSRFRTTAHFDGVCPRLLSEPGGDTEVMVHPLIHGGMICDGRKEFYEVFKRIKQARNSSIRNWRNDA